MTRPIYTGVNDLDCCPPSAHRGLWFDRFFNGYDQTWKIGDSSKKNWIDTVVVGKAGDEAQLDTAKNSLCSLIEKLNGKVCVMESQWHFATGLGNAHPVENGFAWHPTLGVPYLTGAAVKGLVRAWMEEWEETRDNDKLLRWFGSEDKYPSKQKNDNQAGGFIFFDALPIEPVLLARDIMTPHMGKWYAEGDQIRNVDDEPQRIPADWHDPDPVPFLVAKDIKLMFGIAPRNGDAESDLHQVIEALKHSLEWLGAGAKTAVGYGRFSEPEKSSFEKAAENKLVWSNVKITRNKSNGSLTAINFPQTATSKSGKHEEILKAMPKELSEILVAKGECKGDVTYIKDGERSFIIECITAVKRLSTQ